MTCREKKNDLCKFEISGIGLGIASMFTLRKIRGVWSSCYVTEVWITTWLAIRDPSWHLLPIDKTFIYVCHFLPRGMFHKALRKVTHDFTNDLNRPIKCQMGCPEFFLTF